MAKTSSPRDPGTPLRVALADYPYTVPVKNGTIPIAGAEAEFIEVEPIHKVFGPMVREGKYDVCEMALATYLQAREAGVPIRALPVILHANNHHLSLNRLEDGPPIGPDQLIGRSVGVRSYGQTTGMWVRGILEEEFAVASSAVTWLTTQAGHVPDYREPANVVRTTEGATVDGLLRDQTVVAGVIGARIASRPGSGLTPVVPDAETAGLRWMERHGTAAINHLVVVRADIWDTRADEVTALFRALAQAIAQTSGERASNPIQQAIAAGWNPSMRRGFELASRYALEQAVIRTPVDIDELERELAAVAA